MTEYRLFARGDIDLATAPAFRVALDDAMDATRDGIVVDCCELTFIDCSGIAVLIDAKQSMESRGRSLRVEHVSDITERLFDLTGISELLRGNA